MTLELKYVAPEELNSVWPKVREDVLKVLSHSSDTWIPEDMYFALKNNTSTLHLGEEDGQYRGFLVLTPTVAYDGPVLHIWATYSNGNTGLELLTEGMEQIKQFANRMSAKRVTFFSPRKGWDKFGIALGFTMRTQVFAMEVT